MECSVLRCTREVFDEGFCSSCKDLLQDREHYVPKVCWECGAIVDIFKRKNAKSSLKDTIFCAGCRQCSDERLEEKTFLVKKPHKGFESL